MKRVMTLAAAVLALASMHANAQQLPTNPAVRFVGHVPLCDSSQQATDITKAFAKSLADGIATFNKWNAVVDQQGEQACGMEPYVRAIPIGTPVDYGFVKTKHGGAHAYILHVQRTDTDAAAWIIIFVPLPPAI